MTATPKTKESITQSLEKLDKLVRWFDEQQEVDVSEGLAKVKEGAVLVRELKAHLKEVENEFSELKKELESDDAR